MNSFETKYQTRYKLNEINPPKKPHFGEKWLEEEGNRIIEKHEKEQNKKLEKAKNKHRK